MLILRFLLILSLVIGLYSCDSSDLKPEEPVRWTQKQSTQLNERLSKKEDIDINLYIKRRPNAHFISTGTGLRYWLKEDKEGENAKKYDIVDITFSLSLLDGTEIYHSEKGEVSTFRVDKDDVETGLMEGIKYMSEGDKATFIIPSHIAHGLLGDMNEIPPLETIIVDVELLKIHR